MSFLHLALRSSLSFFWRSLGKGHTAAPRRLRPAMAKYVYINLLPSIAIFTVVCNTQETGDLGLFKWSSKWDKVDVLQPCAPSNLQERPYIIYKCHIPQHIHICTVIIYAYSSYRPTSGWFMIIILLHHQPSRSARRISAERSKALLLLHQFFHHSITWASNLNWLVVSTHLKNISQIGNRPQVGMKIKNISNHHLVEFHFPCRLLPSLPSQPSPKTPRTKIIKLRSLSWRRARSKSLL